MPLPPMMDGKLGEMIDKVNQKLQVVIIYAAGTPGEDAASQIGTLLRQVYREVRNDALIPASSLKLPIVAGRKKLGCDKTYTLTIKTHLSESDLVHDLFLYSGIIVDKLDLHATPKLVQGSKAR